MDLEEQFQKTIQDVAKNHRKIIDDWCKAYMAEIYEETGSIKPGDFVLNQQFIEGKIGYKYWFEPKEIK